MGFINRSNRSILIIAVIVIVVIFLYFGGWAQLGSMMGGRGSGGGTMGISANGPGGGWMPVVIALAVGVLIGWLIGKRR
ncbi:MAG: hypothetical protein ABIP75_10165 [Pyrinomonadaceae bacterium]